MCKRLIMSFLLVAAGFAWLFATGCETDAQTGALIGTAAGAGVGQAIGRNTGGTLIGAGVGAGVGAVAAGGTGALYGAGIGAGVGLIRSLFKRGKDVVLPRGTDMTFVISRTTTAKRVTSPDTPTAQ